MSGPIVRKYGFPNHEKIFGARPIEHGVDDGAGESGPRAETPESAPAPEKKPAAKPKSTSSRSKGNRKG